MATPQGKVHSVFLGPIRLVRRGSTSVTRRRDDIVANALEFIRLHSCERISSADVANAMHCSRRYADMRFRKALGSTILDEIHSQRIGAAKDRLRLGETIDNVSKCCGYTSAADFRRVFKRYAGIPPLKWLKRELA